MRWIGRESDIVLIISEHGRLAVIALDKALTAYTIAQATFPSGLPIP